MSFTDDVVDAVTRHMNADHADDSLLICRAMGGVPDATAVSMVGVDGGGADFVATVAGREVPVRIPWSRPITERAEIRTEVVRLHEAALAALEAQDAGAPSGDHEPPSSTDVASS